MNLLLLSTADQDLGLVPAKDASRIAEKEARRTGKAVTVRDPVTDKVKAIIKPNGK